MIEIFACSAIGERDEQQDAYAVEARTMVVADGMGGYAGGAEAASAAVRAIVEELEAPVTRDAIEGAVRWACQEVEEVGAGGTTLVLAHVEVDASGPRALIAWVGDSRAYLVRDGEVEQLTEDHAAASGGLVRWIPDEGHADIVELALRGGDRLVLCTDGVHGVLGDDELADVCTLDDDPAAWLIEQALDAGASDNCTAVVCVLSRDDV